VNILYTTIFTLCSFWASAQNLSEANIHEKNGKVYLELLVQQVEVEDILSSEENCETGTAISFCFRNYVNENLELSVNDGDPLEFTIEASISNQKELQINLSAETGESTINSFQVTNNLFVDDLSSYVNQMKFVLNGTEQLIILDAQNRVADIN
jgi:hypothetical protein